MRQVESVMDINKIFPTEEDCLAHLEKIRWNGDVISPFDPASKVYKCAGSRYKCKNSGKYFTVLTNTMFDNTKIPLSMWFTAIYLIIVEEKNFRASELAKILNITPKSATMVLERLNIVYNQNQK